MNDKTFENIMANLFWELMLLASGIKLLSYWDGIITMVGYAFILIAISMIMINVVVPILKTRS